MINRRGLLLGAGALLVGEPVRRAYSFLQDNPLALSPREQLQRYINAEIKRYAESLRSVRRLPDGSLRIEKQ